LVDNDLTLLTLTLARLPLALVILSLNIYLFTVILISHEEMLKLLGVLHYHLNGEIDTL
jgi:hypothetical protein